MNDFEVSAVLFPQGDFDEWYSRAVEDSGYTHDLYKIRLTNTSLDDSIPSPYIIKHDGEPLTPEQVISRLQRLAETKQEA